MTAENLAKSHGIPREAQHEFALQSHQRATAAIDAGRFEDEIVSIEVKARKGTSEFKVDEPRSTGRLAGGLAKLRLAFDKEGTVTPGNAPASTLPRPRPCPVERAG